MVPRRIHQSFNTLSPQDATFPASTPSSPANIVFPHARSNSPSGISHFLSKPSKWFGRKPSDPRSISIGSEPRSSISSVRRPKISRPTDPRPILSSFQSEPHAMDATKSVVELTFKPKKSLELNSAFPSSSSSQHPSSDVDGSLGDLRNISRKTWSKSADDLRSFPDPSHSTVDISFQHRIQEYRNRSNSSATLHPPTFTNNAIPASTTVQSFPSAATDISNAPSDDMFTLNEPNISISVSSPTSEGFVFPDDSPPTPNARMHSFAPRLPTKLSSSKIGLSPNSPKRKGSGDSMKPLDSDKSSGTSMGRGVFPFSLAGPSHKHSAPNLAAQASANQPSSSLLAPADL
ncbi:hypothetical protein J3R83DRAFT_2464 [Lanmaoa asiatica]|nr:hypothetical protein J3R83DRAFT_2464 [Lanmaoa asiatica]